MKGEGGEDVPVVPSQQYASEIPDEVRAVVPGVDDPETSCETFRAYFLGVVFAVVGTGLNTWFGARQPGTYTTMPHLSWSG